MTFKPIYHRGACIGVASVLGCHPIDYQSFLKWLQSENKTVEQWLAENPPPEPIPPTKEQVRQQRYVQEADPLKAEAEAELRQGRPDKYFQYTAIRNKIRRETEPEVTRLELVKKDQKAYYKCVCDNMLSTRYTSENRDGYTVQLIMAQGKSNKQAYLAQLFVWGAQLNGFYYIIEAAIEGASTVEEILTLDLKGLGVDFDAWLAADPKISFAAAEAIQD